MATMTTPIDAVLRHGYDPAQGHYVIIHPLDDIPEEKIDIDNLGPMALTGAVKWSLLSLRAYLILMSVLVLYRVLEMAGMFGGVR
jgi:hypothetical protein